VNYLIPVHNEAVNISSLLRRILWVDSAAQICLVDSACCDESMGLANGYPVHIRSAPKGYAQALAVGYRFAVQHQWTHLIQLDADGQHDPIYAHALYGMLSKADWVIASRHRTGSFGGLMMRSMAMLSRKMWLPENLQDPSSGYWGLNQKMIQRFSALFPVDFTEIPLRISQQQEGVRIREICIPMQHRKEGISMNSGFKGVVHGLRMLDACRKAKKNREFQA